MSERDWEETQHPQVTRGKSGQRCTKVGRKCVFNATCENQKCKCPGNQRGNAEIECVDRKERLCYFSGDPHVSAFGRAAAAVALPCRFRAARFVTRNTEAVVEGQGSCSVEVFATNELFNGRYVIRSVHISVGIGDSVLHKHTAVEIYKTVEYDVNDTEIYNYQIRARHRDTIWGSSSGNVDGFNIIPSYDDVNNFAMLEVPQCEMRIKYRANDLLRPQHPPQMPGLTIMVSKDALFPPGLGDYPSSVCGSPDDSRKLYRDRAEQLNMDHPDLAILHDILASEPEQTDNVLSGRCEQAIGLFKTSKDQTGDISKCGFLLTKGKVGACIQKAGVFPIDAFNGCLSLQQGGSEGCFLLKKAAQACSDMGDWTQKSFATMTCPALTETTTEPVPPENFW